MPHAALCVSGLAFDSVVDGEGLFQCRTQHCVCRDMGFRTLSQSKYMFQCRTQHCVCRDGEVRARNFDAAEFQCRTQHCVCRDSRPIREIERLFVSMPHAALCVSGRTRAVRAGSRCTFQCRTQHCVCRDSVSRSPCPARAEKVFWKDALFLRRFWRLWMNSAPKSGGSIGAVPCAVRATPFWKVETAVCGFTPVPKHFPFPSPL